MERLRHSIAAGTLLTLLAACGAEPPVPASSYPTIRVSACEQPEDLDRCVLDFGEQQPGSTATVRVNIANISSAADLHLDVLMTHNTAEAFELRPELYDIDITPGGTALLNVAFTASQPGTYTGKATIYSDAAEPRPGPVELLLVGYGADG